MISFREFIVEEEAQPEGQKLKHLEHLNRLPITGGHEGVARAADSLDSVHNMLLGKKMNGHALSTKWDGAPSLVYGYHPETGQFFVASKSAFNKNPKLNFTPEDIERNHGHAPGLVEKLKAALEHLPKTMPPAQKVGGRYPDQVYQGDALHSGKKDIAVKNGRVTFQPNTVEYDVDKNSAEGQKALRSKFGIVTHTRYMGRDLDSMRATPFVDHGGFTQHPDVHMVSPSVKVDSNNYTPEMQAEFANHKEKARRVYQSMKPEAMEAVKGHEIPLESYLNGIIRKSATSGEEPEKPTVQGYVQHLNNIAKKDVDKVKTPAAKERKMQQHADVLQHVNANREHFQKMMDLDNHLSNAKNVLVKALDRNSEYGTSIGGRRTGHEGFVHVDKAGNMQKFVDQSPTGFAAANLAGMGRIAQG
jgi:hypothetical protein